MSARWRILQDEMMGFLGVIESNKVSGGVYGIPTGFEDVDRITGGMQPGELWVVASRPSMGKTSFSLNVAAHVSVEQGLPSIFFNLESKNLVARFLALSSEIKLGALASGDLSSEDWERLAPAIENFSQAPLGFSIAKNYGNLIEIVKEFKAHHGAVGLVVIDYLQLMDGMYDARVETRSAELSTITRKLKSLAIELNVPVVVTSQLNRSLEMRVDKRPMLQDLRDAGAIEDDADVVLFLYRDDYYHKDSKEPNIAEVIIGKQRNGPTGTVKLLFQKSQARFEKLAMDYSSGSDY